MDILKRKKAKKQSYKANRTDVLENAETLYNGRHIIVDAFENQIFDSKYRPEIYLDFDLRPASNTHESHYLTKKEFEMFRKLFSYKKKPYGAGTDFHRNY